MKVTVLGTGGGALAIAADFARGGHDVTIADLPQFRRNLEPIRERGGIQVVSGWSGDALQSVRAEEDTRAAVTEAELLLVVVPCYGHEPNVQFVAPYLRAGQSVIFVGEGSGAILARIALNAVDKAGVRVGETNTLPYTARIVGPASVNAFVKPGGVFLSSIPSADVGELLALVKGVLPHIAAAESVWETVLTNFNAIDHVAAMVTNVGTLENRSGAMLLWGEGATPSVVRLIEAVDEEYLALRRGFELTDPRRYREFLVEQGLAPGGLDLYETLRASRLMTSVVSTGPEALQSRMITEDVPYALVLAASIGDELGIPTPTIDSLIWLASKMLQKDYRATGRSLDSLGLAGCQLEGLRAFAETGEAQ